MNTLPLPTAATSRRVVLQQCARERTSNACPLSHNKRHRVQPSKSLSLRRSPPCEHKRRLSLLSATEEDSSTTEGEPNEASNESVADGQASDTSADAAKLLAEIVANPLFYLVAGLGAIKLVASLGEQVGAIVVLSALPVVGLTLISKSDAGKKVEENLKAKLPELEAAAAIQKEAQDAARAKSEWYGEGRPMWLGPLGTSYEYPHYLEGEAPGDYGFDPLGFSSSPESFARNQECELLHARWAMLAVIGCLIPEALAMNGVELGEAIWWKVGAEKLKGDFTINYAGIEGFRIAGKAGIAAIATCQVALMGGPEYARLGLPSHSWGSPGRRVTLPLASSAKRERGIIGTGKGGEPWRCGGAPQKVLERQLLGVRLASRFLLEDVATGHSGGCGVGEGPPQGSLLEAVEIVLARRFLQEAMGVGVGPVKHFCLDSMGGCVLDSFFMDAGSAP
ncbi:hypothetical protein CYMTET_39088 [Cymbomonas tetramitiformis]|uniref:Chlorophyll a-b binding protein, chloroplastic n=1 Tax=Cymbomonas tetramitiformis TaxID=36881 RepID=A0AAE0CC30_9CHLO|nr:hypothetical protein CYMTET_39088 [Cymbomonas tetramitiformis]